MTRSRLFTALVAAPVLLVFSVGIGLANPNNGQGIPKPYDKRLPGDFELPKKIYDKYLKHSPKDMAIELPASYDARDEGIVTTAKNQGNCGSCWAFASVGAMEAHMLKAYGVGPENLSEQQQVSCNTAMWACNGGSSNAIRYWEGEKGPENESYFLYTASSSTACKESASAMLNYRVTDWHTVPPTPVDFKTSLYVYGPSYWRYNVYSDFYDYWNYGQPGEVYVNNDNVPQGGHAVLLIGWDDSKGAYLCKNSWGATDGPNGDGTFWIAYSGHVNDLSFGMANFTLVRKGCTIDSDCDNGLYCDGQETCGSDGQCQAGTPVTCGANQTCDESKDQCVACVSNADCDNGLYCDGQETCGSDGQCKAGTPVVCGTNETCDEGINQCVFTCVSNADCDNGVYCDGQETCGSDGQCKAGTPVTCANDGMFCNGSEVCNETMQQCSSTGDPCGSSTSCDEVTDQCVSSPLCGVCIKGVCDGRCHPKETSECPDCWW